MDSNEIIRSDASTVHRQVTGDLGSSLMRSSETADSPDDRNDNVVEDAKTVIRGSSRGPMGPKRWESGDRTPAAVAKVLLGQKLNHFVLEELIGGGGMGAVFRARDEQLDRTVAIKVIPFVSEDPDLQRRFRNEAQSAAKLDHPNIARVFDVGCQDDWHYIVFEFISGTNIRDLVARGGPQSIDDAVYYTCQLASAIDHAAERGIVHRDIKPSNVIISDGDQVKLVDMGLARSENLELSEDMTASGVTLGTFDYISPEQARDPRDADVRSDIYSLGCTLYFMLTGRPPYPGGTMLQKLLSHGNAPPPDPRLSRPEVSDDLAAILNKMLAKSPADRYQTARDLVADLKELASRENLTRAELLGATPSAPTSVTVQWLERHLPWLVAASLLLASTLWLQIVSVASRDSFTFVAPEITASRFGATTTEVTTDDSAPTASRDLIGPAAPGGSGATGTNGSINADAARASSRVTTESISPEPSPSANANGTRGTNTTSATNPAAETPNGAMRSPTSVTSDAAAPPRLADVPIPDGLTDKGNSFSNNTSRVADSMLPGKPESTATTSPLAQAPRSIQVVSLNHEAVLSPDVLTARTLSEAVQLAYRHDVRLIEFAVPVLQCEPIRILQDGLVLRSLVGGTELRFEPTENLSMQRSRMISLGDHRIEFEGIHLHWVVGSSEIDGGSLIVLNDNKLVRLKDCAITIENSSRRDEVYAFEVVTDPEMIDQTRRSESTPSPGTLPLVAIKLENVIARGEMTLIAMDVAAELQLQWDNGLLAVSRRLIETSGALEPTSPTSGPIQLSLNRLTTYTPRGMVRMRLGVSGAYPVVIDREARNCVFVVDPGVPHFEITGLMDASVADSWLRLRGEANAYDAEPTLNDPLVSMSDQLGNRQTIRISELLNQSFEWEDERSPRWAVRWSQLELPGVSPSYFTPADFRQDGTVLSGFEERLLPRLDLAIPFQPSTSRSTLRIPSNDAGSTVDGT